MSLPRVLVTACALLLLAGSGFAADDPAAWRAAGTEALAAGDAAAEAGDAAKAATAYGEAQGLFKKAKDKRAAVAGFLGRSAQLTAEGKAAEAAAQMNNAGTAWMGAGDPARAVATLRAGIAMAEKAGHATWAGRGRAMLTQAHFARGEFRRAVEVGTEAMAGLAAIPDARGAAAATISVAKAHFQLQEQGKAASILERGLAYAEEAKFGAAIDMAVSWLAWTYYHLGDFKKARTWYARELALRKAQKRAEPLDNAYVNLGGILWELGEVEALEAHASEGLAHAEGSKRPLLAAEMQMLLANLAVVEGQQRLGLKQFVEAEKILAAHGAVQRLPVVYRGMARAFRRMGRPEKALRYLEKSAAAAEGDTLAGERLRSYIDLAGAHGRLGRLTAAIEFAEKAVPMARKLKDRANEAAATSVLGAIHFELNDLERALELHRSALAMARALGDRRQEVTALGNVGVILTRLGEFEDAGVALRGAVELAGSRGDEEAGIIFAHSQVHLLQAAGKAKEARALADRTLERADAFGDPVMALRARMVVAQQAAGWASGEEQIELLREIADDAHSYRDVLTEVPCRAYLAEALLASGDARAALREAKAGARELEDLLGGLGDAQGTSARAQYAKLYHTGALAAVKVERPADAFRLLEQARAGMLVGALRAQDLIDWSALPEELVTAQAQARAKVSQAQRGVARAGRRRDRKARRAARTALEVALAEQRSVVDRLQRAAKQQAALAFPRVPPLREIQDALEPHQAFVLYGLGAAEAIAVVVTAEDERAVTLGAAQPIRDTAAAIDLGEPGAKADAELAALRKALVTPLALAKDVTEVIVSPDGQLCQTPLGLVFETQRLAMTPSATTYAYLAEDSKVERGAKVLAMGDPAYTSAGSAAVASVFTRAGSRSRGKRRSGGTKDVPGTRGRGSLMPLPATRPEVKTVGDVVLLGNQASEAGFRAAVGTQKRWRSVHFACHGLVNPDAADLCALALTPGGDDDGFLTAQELMQMRVPTDLAVLSACETGRGQVVSGEGLLGLARSFIHAGAPRIVCSLWKVDDEATKAFMVKFYELWNPKEGDGIPPAEALRKAQAHVRAQPKWKAPYYWGAWVLWGLPR